MNCLFHFAVRCGNLVKRSLKDTIKCYEDSKFYRNPERPTHKMWTNAECSKYYLCLDGEVFEFKCSVGLLFDVMRQICDFKQNVDNCDVTAGLLAVCTVVRVCYKLLSLQMCFCFNFAFATHRQRLVARWKFYYLILRRLQTTDNHLTSIRIHSPCTWIIWVYAILISGLCFSSNNISLFFSHLNIYRG